MLTSFPAALLAGAVLGFLAALGIGGGSLLMLWLTLLLGMEYPQARLINLMFFVPCALIACLMRWRQGTLPLSRAIPAAIAGCACALIFTVLSRNWELEGLKKLFGALLIVTGIRELCYRPKEAR